MSDIATPLALTMGDPAGCGPQITIAAWKARTSFAGAPFYVIGDPRLYQRDTPIKTIESPSDAVSAFDEALPVIPLEIEGFAAMKTGIPFAPSAPAIIESIRLATQHCLSGAAIGMVTNPISKAVLYEAGFTHPGHTEFIADLCTSVTNSQAQPVMMLVGGGLRVALATIHVPLMRVLEQLTPRSLSDVATITYQALARDFAIANPKIAFTGLNPHAGEDGNIGHEEVDLINPVASVLHAEGVDIADARPADTVFHEALQGDFDAVIAMTHDQGLIPVKTLDLWGGVNTTLGLPIIRTSPDHGTAYDAAADGSARPDSLIAALKLAAELANNRNAANG